MNDSIENSLGDDDDEQDLSSSSILHNVVLINSNTVKANILLGIQRSATVPPPLPPEIIKFKLRCILDDLKASLLHRKYWRLLFKTVLIQLIKNHSERLRSQLWYNLIVSL